MVRSLRKTLTEDTPPAGLGPKCLDPPILHNYFNFYPDVLRKFVPLKRVREFKEHLIVHAKLIIENFLTH